MKSFFVEQLRALLYLYKNCVTWSRGVFRTQSNIYDGSFLEKKNFSKKLYHRCVRVGSKYASVMMPPDDENQSMLKKASLRIFVNFHNNSFSNDKLCFPNINLSIFSYWKLLMWILHTFMKIFHLFWLKRKPIYFQNNFCFIIIQKNLKHQLIFCFHGSI